MASSQDIKSRLETSLKTPKGSFSQVVAVTQGAINLGLLMLFNLKPELANIKFKNRNGDMDGILSTGRITLPVEGSNYGQVNYYCTFVSGSVTLWDDDLDDWGQPINMKDWIFAFAVEMGKINLDESSPEYDEVKNVINQPGDYTITRLYIDFNTHQIATFNERLSSFNGRKWKNASEKNYFISLMLKWGDPGTSRMADPKNTTIGYAASTDNPGSVNSQAPTFPPTSMIFQRYNYMAPGETEPHSGLDEKGNRNMLLYLEMTENLPFPPERFLTYSGNFSIPEMSGTIAISRTNFWDKFLLRARKPGLDQLLRTFNEVTFGWCKSVWVDYNGTSIEWSANYGLGPGSGLDSAPDFFAWQGDGVLGWKWSKSDYKKADKGWGGVFDGTLEFWCDTNNKMTMTPGTNIVKISGETKMAQKLNTHFLGIGEGFEAVATMTWSLNMTIKSVLAGGMEIALNLPPNTTDLFKISTYIDSWPGSTHDGEANKLKDRLTASIARAPFQQAKEQLETALRSTARFVLPGANTFFYKNAIFNNNGDILLQLEYDGVS